LIFTKQASGGVWGGTPPQGTTRAGFQASFFFSFLSFLSKKKPALIFLFSLFSLNKKIKNRKSLLWKACFDFFFSL
jgi:hypothetical protein